MQSHFLAVVIASALAVSLAGGCSSSGSGYGCHEITGNGSGEVCTYGSTPGPAACVASKGASGGGGSCPSAGLSGCCVRTVSQQGVSEISAECYYSPAAASAAMQACSMGAAAGTWSTNPP